MRIVQQIWNTPPSKASASTCPQDHRIQLVLAFGDRNALVDWECYTHLHHAYPNAEIMIGSSAGEILGTTVTDGQVCITAIEFSKSLVRSASVELSTVIDRFDAGKRIAQKLQGEDLAMLLVVADGQNVNGSELVAGINATLNGTVPVVGGLAGDGANFEFTVVGLNAVPTSGNIAAIGLYGKDLSIAFGSQGGWEGFGPERKITESAGNVLYGLDGSSALELYKLYLGDLAAQLPSSGLRFPLSIKQGESGNVTVRTLLAVDEVADSMTFAGDVPKGATARLMKSSFDRLVTGAAEAADECKEQGADEVALAILISCVGRKLILNQRAEEEVEEIAKAFPDAAICGFYSYGELSPRSLDGICELHNQTLTITTISEK